MKPRTVAVALVLFFLLVVAGVLGASQLLGSGGTLTERWVSDTARDATGNHHAPTAKRLENETLVIIPVNNDEGERVGDCALYAFSAELGERWQASVPAEGCNIHTFGDPTIADLDGDGDDEVFVATTEEVVRAHDARTGEELFRHELSGWGYTAPFVTDFTPAPGRELIVADLSGGVSVFAADGSVIWNHSFSSVIAPISIDDFDADGSVELVVGEGGNVTVVEPDGTIANQTPVDGSVTWMTVGDADGDPAIEIIAATSNGRVVAVDGGTGNIEWTQQYNTLAAVSAFGDGDDDGRSEVYAVAQDGILRALDASDGTAEWSTTLTTEDVQMTPPPALGDLDGDGTLELVAVSQDGAVAVLNAKSGSIIDTYKRDVPIWMRPTLADLDGDGTLDILIIYGDGRVVALAFEGE